VLPVLALSGAGIGLLETDTAMWMAKWIPVAALGIIVLLAVRRTQLAWWQQVLTIAGLTGVGVLVVGIKMLAH
jgi:hypothetical protein